MIFTDLANYVLNGLSSLGTVSPLSYLVCGVTEVTIEDQFNCPSIVTVFYPSHQRSRRRRWFPRGVSGIVRGRLKALLPEDQRSAVISILCWLVVSLSRFIPIIILPALPAAYTDNQPVYPGNGKLPLVLWFHGMCGGVHDHSLLCAEVAVNVPAVVIAITHSDGTADFSINKRNENLLFRNLSVPSIVNNPNSNIYTEYVEMREYQIRQRIEQSKFLLRAMIASSPNSSIGKIMAAVDTQRMVLGGFDFGGATAVAMASSPSIDWEESPERGVPSVCQVRCCISLDGTFSLVDKVQFPRNLFANPVRVPVGYIVSEEWQDWKRCNTANTRFLAENSMARDNTKVINARFTNHLNLTECMYWIPSILVPLLQLCGLLHRHGDPRKTYKRTSNWVVEFIQKCAQEQQIQTYL